MKSNKSKNIVKADLAIQNEVGTMESDGSTLKHIWFELPGYCNLACSYCYAEGGKPKNPEKLLGLEGTLSLLEEAKEMGVEAVGIPGAGEPFFGKKNTENTFKILEKCRDLGFYVTLFTTGEFIDEEIADRLWELPVEVMIKGNSLIPEVQDAFVSDPKRNKIKTGYGQKRNDALDLLMAKGFNDPEKIAEQCEKFRSEYGVKLKDRKSRMALVTSIMTSCSGGPTNYDEMADLMHYARKKNIIFDVDSVLKVGRGTDCGLCEEDQRLKAKLQELQAIDLTYGNEWELSQSYIGTVCDRFNYHMYIDQEGTIRPCIGATGVNLGNIKEVTLEQAWNSPAMKIIRNRKYIGKCGDECANFAEIDEKRTAEAGTPKYKCNSCLGRRTGEDDQGKRLLTTESILKDDGVKTYGCWNFRLKEK